MLLCDSIGHTERSGRMNGAGQSLMLVDIEESGYDMFVAIDCCLKKNWTFDARNGRKEQLFIAEVAATIVILTMSNSYLW